MATQNNKKVLDKPEWQTMCSAPVASSAGAFIIKDPIGERRGALYLTSATVHYLYAADEDSWMQVPSMALAGTWGAGACGCYGNWSNTLTANGGSTTTVTTATSINGAAYGNTIRFLTGANAGLERECTGYSIIPGGTNTLSFAALPNVVSSGDTFALSTGIYYILNAYTSLVSGVFKSYDPLTGVVSSLGTTNLPASWGTDGKLVGTPSYVGTYATGTATSATNTTLVNSAKAWTADQWINAQIRITGGTGIGQIRTITDNDATSVTVATWTVNPDSTSTYAIEPNDDFFYLAGNGAVTMYRYSRSANSWTVMAPTTARTGAPSTGMGLNWCGKSGNAIWENENNCLDGRFLYSFRGGASSNMDRFDIAGGTAGAGAWLAVTYLGKQETFSTGSSYDMGYGCKLYARKDATKRIFQYDITGNYLYPFATDFYADGTALLGDKLFTVTYDDETGGDLIEWLYVLQNTGTVLRRVMIY
jgi:hypothetical protein